MSTLPNYEESDKAKAIAKHIEQILPILGLDVTSESYERTPIRIATAWLHMCSGYGREVSLERLYTEKADLVAKFGIPFVSMCEHHFAPFHGTVDLGYIPHQKKITGMSKLTQLVEKYALRPQIQERMTEQIANELDDALHPKGCVVVSEAIHTCELIEGYQPTKYVCSELRGVFLLSEAPRNEFMNLRIAQRR